MTELFLGVSALAAAALIVIPLIWKRQDHKQIETEHDRYVREWQRAQYCWRHPRAARHARRHRMAPRHGEAPLPMEWW